MGGGVGFFWGFPERGNADRKGRTCAGNTCSETLRHFQRGIGYTPRLPRRESVKKKKGRWEAGKATLSSSSRYCALDRRISSFATGRREMGKKVKSEREERIHLYMDPRPGVHVSRNGKSSLGENRLGKGRTPEGGRKNLGMNSRD